MEKKVDSFTDAVYRDLVNAVNKLPKEAIERSKGIDTRKGYDTTGYQYQFLVNILNEIVGVANWSMEYKIVKEIEGTFKTGQKNWEITVEIKITILDAVRSCAGGHKAALHCDALKGAITSALKKTLGLFGIGKKAYEGTIDDDYKPLPNDDTPPPQSKKVSIPPEKPKPEVKPKNPDIDDFLNSEPKEKTIAEQVDETKDDICKLIVKNKFKETVIRKIASDLGDGNDKWESWTDLSALNVLYNEIAKMEMVKKTR